MAGAEKDGVVGFEFGEDIELGVVVDREIVCQTFCIINQQQCRRN